MADYYPLLSRAVSGLDHSTGEARRTLYERARTALVNQLNSVQPELSVSEITRERLALEEAIRRVEAEAAERSREEEARAAPPSVPPPPAEPEDEEPDVAPPDPAWAVEPPKPAPKEPSPSLTDRGLKGYREIMGEAEELGAGTTKAAESARDVYEAIPPAPGTPPLPPRPRERDTGASRREAPPHRATTELPTAHDLDQPEQAEAAARPQPYEDLEDGYVQPRRSYGPLILIAVLVLLVLGVGAAAYWQRDTIAGLYHSVMASFRGAPTPPKEAAGPQQRPKIADRIGPGAQQDAKNNAAAVAQKVVLYEEDPNDPQGKRFVGSVIWRTETVSPGPGLAPELAIRADIDIPERKMRMSWSLRRNTDTTLPASHTIEIMFTVPPDFDGGGISNVPGVLMKQSEQTRGVPLAGLAVKVTNNFFLIGLSAVEADVQRNVQLLKERSWFDVPVVYNNNRRAIIAVEKGTPGERVFEDAFRAWGQ